VGAGPFGRSLTGRSQQPGIERGLPGKAGQHGGHRPRIVTSAAQILDAEVIRLGFLRPRERESQQLRALREYLLTQLAQRAVTKQCTRNYRSQHPEDRILGRSLLALGRMARGHVSDLVPKHACKFSLVVHQRNELAGDVDIAAGDRKSVIDR